MILFVEKKTTEGKVLDLDNIRYMLFVDFHNTKVPDLRIHRTSDGQPNCKPVYLHRGPFLASLLQING